ncbi:hypothetical protein [Flavobacterium sp.]|uniref:hypothetical protein n=1 Tax=Flavobacterium sp. TaxID=239 RepID=UPI0025C05BEB|nr:hypothetical protein [Flavobacterium sp.]
MRFNIKEQNMNYTPKIDQNNPHSERLEKAITNLLPFVAAEAVYVSYNRRNKVMVITFIMKKECNQDTEALSVVLDKLIKVYPDFIFKFIDSDCASLGFRKGKPFFIRHCTLKELVYFEPGAEVFYPQKNTSKKLIRRARKRFYLDLEAAVVSFRNVSVYTGSSNNIPIAFALYQTLRYIYICASEFFTPVFITSTCLFTHYDYSIGFTPELKKILNKDVETDNEILKMLNMSYSCVMEHREADDINPELLAKAKAKVELLQKEINKLFLEYKIVCREKMQKLSYQKCTAKHIFSDKIPSNYFIDDALKNIGAVIAAAFEVRCIYCFGYTINHNKEQGAKNYSDKLPRYHFYLLIVSPEPFEDEVRLMKELIQEKFESKYKVTILSHCSESISKKRQDQKYFFDHIFTNGLLVYSNPFYLSYPKKCIAKWESPVNEKYQQSRLSKAQQFFDQAQNSLSYDSVGIKKVLFRKVIEQICAGLIYLHLGYPSGKLSIDSLFSLLKYIQDIELPFDCNNEKEKTLFRYLSETAVVPISAAKQYVKNEYDKLIEYKCILFLKHANDLAEKAAEKLDYKKTRFFS